MAISSVNTWGFREELTKAQLNSLDSNLSNRLDKRNGQADDLKSEISVNTNGKITVDNSGFLTTEAESVNLLDGYFSCGAEVTGSGRPLSYAYAFKNNVGVSNPSFTTAEEEKPVISIQNEASAPTPTEITIADNPGSVKFINKIGNNITFKTNNIDDLTVDRNHILLQGDTQRKALTRRSTNFLGVYSLKITNEVMGGAGAVSEFNPANDWDNNPVDGYLLNTGIYKLPPNPIRIDFNNFDFIKYKFHAKINSFERVLFCLAYRLNGSVWQKLKPSLVYVPRPGSTSTPANSIKSGVAIFRPSGSGFVELGFWAGSNAPTAANSTSINDAVLMAQVYQGIQLTID